MSGERGRGGPAGPAGARGADGNVGPSGPAVSTDPLNPFVIARLIHFGNIQTQEVSSRYLVPK